MSSNGDLEINSIVSDVSDHFFPESELNIGDLDGARILEGIYKMEVPQEVMEICELLRNSGGHALLVGGCVRDMVIAQELPEFAYLEPKDFDLEVYGISLDKLEEILAGKYGDQNVRWEGSAFCVLKVSLLGIKDPVDLSIPRRDSKVSADSFGRGRGFKASGDPGMSVVEAAARRDLVFNTMAYDPITETLYDPYGGVESIREREIRVINPESFKEDPLRVLRVMQFSARFDFDISASVTQLCKEMVEAGSLDDLPRERITEEFKKLFTKGKRPSLGLNFIREIGLVERWFPQLQALIGCEQDSIWHPEGDVWNHTLQVLDAAAEIAEREKLTDDEKLALGLVCLGHDLGKPSTTSVREIDGRIISHGHEYAGVGPMKDLLRRFNFSKRTERQVFSLISRHLAPKFLYMQEHPGKTASDELIKPVDMTRALRRLSRSLEGEGASLKLLVLLAEADQRGRNGESSKPLAENEVEDLSRWEGWILERALQIKTRERNFSLSGEQVMQTLGIRPGPEVGAVLWAWSERLFLSDNGSSKGLPEFSEDAKGKLREVYEGLRTYVARAVEEQGVRERDMWVPLARGLLLYEDVFGGRGGT